MRQRINLTNKTFGRLTVSHLEGDMWMCRCSCGNPDLVPVRGDNLRNLNTRSCGCLRGGKTRAERLALKKVAR